MIEKKPMGRAMRVASVVAWVVLGVGVWSCFLPVPEKAGPPKPLTPEEAEFQFIAAAKHVCKAGVMQVLNDPDSAKFTPAAEWTAKKTGEATVLVDVNLRAKNGYGALMLGNYICEVEKSGSDWKVIQLDQKID